jgi:hypothetical protein
MVLLTDLLILLHVLLVVVWLGFDFVVFALSLSLLKRELSPTIRLERAHLAEVIDKYVLIAFLATMPLGVLLTYLRGWSVAATPWLGLKLIFFGVIVLLAIRILTGAAGTTQTLKQLVAGAGEAETLEVRLRQNVIGMAPYALGLHLCIIVMIFLAQTRGNWF